MGHGIFVGPVEQGVHAQKNGNQKDSPDPEIRRDRFGDAAQHYAPFRTGDVLQHYKEKTAKRQAGEKGKADEI